MYNRGFWEESLHKEFKRINRNNNESCLLMFDINHFKHVNDNFGHAGGDAAIRHIADVLKKTLRESDVAGRYGGEEFAVTLVDTDIKGAVIFAERFRKTIENSTIFYQECEIKIKISLGVAKLESHFTKHEDWIVAADNALYQSKENGRNKVTVYKSDKQ